VQCLARSTSETDSSLAGGRSLGWTFGGIPKTWLLSRMFGDWRTDVLQHEQQLDVFRKC
jgi:hypothetical protein